MKASRGAIDPSSASEPAVVVLRSPVSTLSLIRTGMPCSGPRGPFAFLSAAEQGRFEALCRDLGDRPVAEASAALEAGRVPARAATGKNAPWTGQSPCTTMATCDGERNASPKMIRL